MRSRPRFGCVTPDMEAVLAQHVGGKEVWDLGAGNLWHARNLVRLGAKEVVAVDKCEPPRAPEGVRTVQAYFAELTPPDEGIEVAYVAWPIAHVPGLVSLLCESRLVVYLGCNMHGSACGDANLFRHLLGRDVVEHVTDRRNSLIVYGGISSAPRALLPEEWAATRASSLWSLEEAIAATFGGQASTTPAPDTFWK